MRRNVAALVLVPIATIFILRSTARAQPPTTTTTPSTTTAGAATTTGGKSIWDGVYTEEQAKRGGPLYAEYCASCHGPELMGGEMAPPLATGDFLSGWDGLTVGELFERIRISMPQNAPGSLSGAQNADILAFMFAANKFPAGQTELSNSAMMLKAIKFEVKKPEKP
jgi:S-disulfanyl-L-cysteine oxidoreductase SoxD